MSDISSPFHGWPNYIVDVYAQSMSKLETRWRNDEIPMMDWANRERMVNKNARWAVIYDGERNANMAMRCLAEIEDLANRPARELVERDMTPPPPPPPSPVTDSSASTPQKSAWT